MKKIYLQLFIVIAIILACKSSAKLVEEGNYDKAIEKSIKNILKGKADEEDIALLDKAYNLANTRDLDDIKMLKSEGRPENWEQIYFIYSALDYRQSEVRKVLPLRLKGKVINYQQVDYTNLIVEAKINAADYFYNNGKRLMALKSKLSYRDAYYNLLKAKNYRGSAFPDIDQLISDAVYFGTSRVLVDVSNNTPMRLPPDFFDNLLAINTSELNTQWIEYFLGQSDRRVEFDYILTIQVKNIIVSPERFSQKEFVRRKTVQDGFSYALDSRGNVKKDTLGNDIKIIKYKDLVCTVMERQQLKETTVEAQIEFLSIFPNRRVIKLVPVGATSIFEHYSGKARGDMDALLPEDLKLIQMEPAPFPDDISMIYNCIPNLQRAITDVLNQNKYVIE